jgi:hypothetical protein
MNLTKLNDKLMRLSKEFADHGFPITGHSLLTVACGHLMDMEQTVNDALKPVSDGMQAVIGAENFDARGSVDEILNGQPR